MLERTSEKCRVTIGERLKQWRAKSGLGQKEAASLVGVKLSSYQKNEMDISAPGAEAIEVFIRAGINANWLLTGEGEMLLKDAPAAADIPSEVHSVPSHSTAHHVMREPPPAGYAFKTGDEPSEEDTRAFLMTLTEWMAACGELWLR